MAGADSALRNLARRVTKPAILARTARRPACDPVPCMHRMKIVRRSGLVMLLSVAGIAAAQKEVDQEIARLEQTLKAVQAAPDDVPKEVRDLFDAHRAALERARKASSPEYRLYRLRDPFVGIETLAFLAKEKSAGGSVEQFERLWRKNAARFETKSPEAR